MAPASLVPTDLFVFPVISRRHRRDTGHHRRFLELDVFVSSTAVVALVLLQDGLGIARLRVVEGWGLEG